MVKPEEFLSADEKKEVAQAIALAERNTSSEIRVFIEKKCKEDPVKRAVAVFRQLEMQRTMFHTGVLIYIASADQSVAIIGDQGIHEKVPENFWDDEVALLKGFFAEGKFAEGIIAAVAACGVQLHKHFPMDGSNPDELSNQVVIGET
jgi:uncharacterized membrane protein